MVRGVVSAFIFWISVAWVARVKPDSRGCSGKGRFLSEKVRVPSAAMIVSHRHRFIFLKTGKTAGTSVEIALSGLCGPEDVITPIVPEDEAVRTGMGCRGPQHWVLPVSAWTGADWIRVLRRPTRPGKARPKFYHHMPAAEAAPRLGSGGKGGVWDSYFKFCFARNPWDRAVSMYDWRYRDTARPSMREFLFSPAAERLRDGSWGLYTIDGRVAVDRVCRFEFLESDLRGVLDGLGVTDEVRLPVTKAGTRRDRRPYWELFDDACRERVAELCAAEIGLMGYRFGEEEAPRRDRRATA